MTDLTKITTPFGLLDPATQDALRSHGSIEYFNCNGEWEYLPSPAWGLNVIYRVKPQPPKPREFWVHSEDDLVLPYEPDVDGSFKANGYTRVREVLE